MNASESKLATREQNLLTQIERCRREIELSAAWLAEHPEWLDRPAAQHGGYTWADSLALAERQLSQVRQEREAGQS
jgi:hypothetical protein